MRVFNDILAAIDNHQDVVLVYWVSVSSAFDTIDHTLFLKRFQYRYEIGKFAPQ